MYAETGLMFPYFQSFSQDCSHKTNASSLDVPSNLIQTSLISDYDLGGEGDLFKAPEPIIEEPLMSLNPMAATISMISCAEDVIPTQSLTVSDIESSIKSGQLLSEVFYECRKDLLAKDGNETPLSEVLSITIPTVITEEKLLAEGPFQKSASSSCLRSIELADEVQMKPNFLDFSVMDFGAMYGMRRAFSDGDIKDRARSLILSFCGRLLIMIIKI